MIVNVRGPCGGGKSTVVRAFARDGRPVYLPGRKIPYGYVSDRCFVVGSYARMTMGGADSFRTLDEVWQAIETYARYYDVLFEGKSQNRDVPGLLVFAQRYDVAVLALQTTAEEAIKAVRARASANRISAKIIDGTWRKSRRDAETLEKAGVAVYRVTRDSAIDKLKELLP